MEELEIIQDREVNGLRVFVNTVNYRTPHFHPEWELIWVLNAPLAVTCRQKQYVVQPGGLVLFSPNSAHEFHKVQQDCTFLCLQISSQALGSTVNIQTEDICLDGKLSKENTLWLKKTMLKVASAYLYRTDFYDLYCLGKCGLMLHHLLTNLPYRILSAEEAENTDRKNARLMRLIQFVDEHYMQKIRLSDFAQQEGCSVSYISHFVKEALNMTFQDYVNTVRFNCARKLIAAGNRSMVNISMESGFSDYRYFSRAFQDTFGMTPAEYSQQAVHFVPEETHVHHSIHSLEQIHTRGRSLQLLQEFKNQIDSES